MADDYPSDESNTSDTDLSDYDSELETVETERAKESAKLFSHDPPRSYSHGRCRAIVMGSRQRCPEPVSTATHADGVCDYHAQHNPYRIDDDPERLIVVTGRLGRLFLNDLDPDSVDFDVRRIRDAVSAVTGDASE